MRDYISLLVQIRQIKQKINDFLCITGAKLTLKLSISFS